MSRTGKIARLPRGIREELNRRLQNGEQGDSLLAWLNPLAEVQTVLQAEFEGAAISKQNLSEWRNGGFAEWEFKGDHLLDAGETQADAEELATATKGRLADHLAMVLTARYASLVRRWNGEVTPEFRLKLNVLQGMIQNVSHLRRWDHQAEKLRMAQEIHEAQREKTDEEVIAHFEEWVKRPAVQDWLCQKWKTPVEREQEKRRLLGRKPMTREEIAQLMGKSKDQNSKSKVQEGAVGGLGCENDGKNGKNENPGEADAASGPLPATETERGGDCRAEPGLSKTQESEAGGQHGTGTESQSQSKPVAPGQTSFARPEAWGSGLGAGKEVAGNEGVEPRAEGQIADAAVAGESNPVAPGQTSFAGSGEGESFKFQVPSSSPASAGSSSKTQRAAPSQEDERNGQDEKPGGPEIAGSQALAKGPVDGESPQNQNTTINHEWTKGADQAGELPQSPKEPACVVSPCVGFCQRDDGGYCKGCLRAVAEIVRWNQMPEAQKRQVLEHVAVRRQRRGLANEE